MADQSQISEPTELVYSPAPSWAPIFTAGGLMALTIGLFKGVPYEIVGAILMIRAIMYWMQDADRQVERLPRQQRLTTAVIPATTLSRDEE